MPNTKQRPEVVESLARGLAVIEAFDDAHPEMTLSEVARRVQISPSTVRRSLRTLESLGYMKCLNKRFLLTPRILTLGSAYLRAARVEDAFIPELRRIVSLFGDAASVSILDGTEILYLAHVSEQRGIRPTAGIGVTYPAYATSMGRVLLAALPAAEFDRYFAAGKFEKLTDVTETDPRKLKEVVREAQKKGYATVVDQLAYGVTSLAVPIFGRNRQVIAALNTSGYSGRTTPKALIEERLPELRVSAGRVENVLTRYPALLHSLIRGEEQSAGLAGPQ